MLQLVQNTPTGVVDSDTDLLPGLKAGDERALGLLMDRHMSKIHSLAFYMLGDQMMAEDITQTVFLKTWTHAKDWQPGKAKLLTWMRRVATNACLDALKKKKPIYTDIVPDISDDADTPFQALAKTEQANRVKAALGVLPDNQRAAMIMSYYQGLSQKEGSAILDVSESAYESLLARARKTLKTTLANEADTLTTVMEG